LLQQSNIIDNQEFEGTDDMQILKEMIISQREALNDKDNEIDFLTERTTLLDEYMRENDEYKTFKSQLTEAKSTIDKLTSELNMHETNEENAKELIIKLTEEKKAFEENEKKSLQLIEELSEKKEIYKSKVKEIEKKLETITHASADDKSHLINDYESEKEDLIIQNVNYVKKINDLQQIVDDLSDGKTKYEEKIKSLRDKLEYVKISAIEEVSEFDEEKEKIVKEYESKIKELESEIKQLRASKLKGPTEHSTEIDEIMKDFELKEEEFKEKIEKMNNSFVDEKYNLVSEFQIEKNKIIKEYENKIKFLESKIKNIENSFIEIKTTLEAENRKYKYRIIELQKEIQKLIKTGDYEKPKKLEGISTETRAETEIIENVEVIKIETDIEPEREIVEDFIRDVSTISTEHFESEPPVLLGDSEEIIPEENKFINDPIIDSIRKCPKCGNQKKNLIREELDKKNIIMAYPRMYGMKYVCGAFGCGCNWRLRNDKIEIL